jgi:hypothetical protein
MPIVPDTKDWTWVLERRCPECDFDTRNFDREDIGKMIRENAALWRDVLTHPDVGRRPADNVWSALEYGCHVRDVFGLYHERLGMMLEQNDPDFPNWDQDAASVEARYSEQDPGTVFKELEATAEHLAARFDTVAGDQWNRTGTRSDGARFTVESFARYLIHDPIHHLHEVKHGFAGLRSR